MNLCNADNASPVVLASTSPARTAAAKGVTKVTYTLQYDGPPALLQTYSVEITEESFRQEIAPARTFVMESEVKELQAKGLGQGANTDNTLVIGSDGVVDNELRFPDEYVRHKILDIIGDLYLLGYPIRGQVTARLTGHRNNIALLRAIREQNS